MTTNFKQIYATQAAAYDAMVSREDYQGNLWTALRQIRDFAGLDVVDVGAGTGRVTRLLAPHVERITAVDLSHHMLQQANLPVTAVAEAIALTQFFFGDVLADKIRQQQLTILPEFTGIWWRDKTG